MLQPSCEGFQAFQEGEPDTPDAPRSVLPVFRRDAASLWQRSGIKPPTHEAVS